MSCFCSCQMCINIIIVFEAVCQSKTSSNLIPSQNEGRVNKKSCSSTWTPGRCAAADASPRIALGTYLQKLWLPSPRPLASIFLAVNFRPLRDVEFQLMHSAPEWLILHVPRYDWPRPTVHFSLVSVGRRGKAKLNVVSSIYIWD